MKNNLKFVRILASLIALVFIVSCGDEEKDSPIQVSAKFEADETEILVGESVSFQDKSTGLATSWKWSFPGGSPSTSLEKNPKVTYAAEGSYDVELIVSNGPTSDTLKQMGFILVTEEEIPFLVPEGLRAYFPFNGDAKDESPTANGDYDGLVSGATLTTDRFGNEKSAYNFADAQIDVALASTESYTFSAWVKVDADGTWDDNWMTLMEFGEAGEYSPFFGTVTGGLPKLYTLIANIEGSTALSTDSWSFFVATYDNETGFANMYVDNILAVGRAEDCAGLGSPLSIGRSKVEGDEAPWYGDVDEIRIYDRVLSSDEMTLLFEETQD